MFDETRLLFVVVFSACNRSERVEAVELVGAQLDAICTGVLLDSWHALRSRDGDDVISLGEQPGQRDLGRGAPHLVGDGLDFVGTAQIVREVLSTETRVRPAEVGLVQVVDRSHLAGQHPAAQGRVGHEANAESSRSTGSVNASGSRVHNEYSDLQGGDGMDAVGSADRLGTRL